MAVITQNYDIDLKATGERPVVKMSQFDTGSRTIVFTVYDGHELAHIDGCVARVDGTRSDGVEFSRSCTVGAGSKVSFTISQEMTKAEGKHAAELVIIDSSGNPIGTQNFVIDVEAAPMVRDAAASADDRTLYDQYTDSVEQKFSALSTSLTDTLTAKTDALTKTVQDIDALLGGSSTAQTIINQNVTLTLSGKTSYVRVVLTYDPISGMSMLNVGSETNVGGVPAGAIKDIALLTIPTDYLPADDKFIGANASGNVRYYPASYDGYTTYGTDKNWGVGYFIKDDGQLFLRFMDVGDNEGFAIGCSASWVARGGRYLGVTPIPTGSNTITVGTTTTVDGGSEASVTNSGTAKDVVLDFEIPTQSFKGEGEDSIAISANGDAQATKYQAIAIGKNAKAPREGAIVIGSIAKAENVGGGRAQVVIGSGAVGGNDSVCIGGGAGSGDKVPIGSVNVGAVAYAPYPSSVAVGSYAKATGHTTTQPQAGSDAYGSNAKATGAWSVALGGYSYASEDNVVSVGQGEKGVSADGNRVKTRRIVNVADPVNAQDAATKNYVDTHTSSGGYTLPAATASTLGGVKVGDNLTVTEDGTLAAKTLGAFNDSDNACRIAVSTSAYTGVLCASADKESFDIGFVSTAKQFLKLKPATASTLGGVKIGAGINVTADGTINVQALVDRIAALESKVAALGAK